MLKDGYSYLVPLGLLDYFEILKVEDDKNQINIYLEDKNNINNPEKEK